MGLAIKNNKKRKAQKPARKKSVRYSNLPDLSNDPYFVKKAESAKELLKKSGLLKD
jgi:hypothetical protein